MTNSEIAETVAAVVLRARAAQKKFESCSQQDADRAALAAGWAVVNPDNNHLLSRLGAESTGLGNAEDKFQKNRRKTLGLLRNLQGKATVGVIRRDDESGITEIARPLGVVGAVAPSTNPVATPANNIINAVKCRNAIIVAPSPKGEEACAKLLELVHKEFVRADVPTDLALQLPRPASKESTREMMRQVDTVIATGSRDNVHAAYASGTPALGVGPGNVAVIVDETADIQDAAAKIARSKVFDFATSCSSENNLIAVESIADNLMDALNAIGGRLLNSDEKNQLQKHLWKDGQLNRKMIAQSARRICELADLTRSALRDAEFLMVQEIGAGAEFPFSGEKLCPVLTVYRSPNFDSAVSLAEAILNYQGKGHSVGIHTRDNDRALKLGLELPICRVIVNQAHCFAAGGSFDNGLPFSLSMGCGSWGGNSISDNLHYRHFLNITRISVPIPVREIGEDEIFGGYLREHA